MLIVRAHFFPDMDSISAEKLSDTERTKTPVQLVNLIMGLITEQKGAKPLEWDDVIAQLKSIYEYYNDEAVADESARKESEQALAEARIGRRTVAVEILERLTKKYSNDGTLWALLGSQYALLGQLTQAHAASMRALSIDRRCSRAWLNVGAYYNEAGDREKEQDAYLRALHFDPRRFDLWMNLHRSYVLDNKGALSWRCLGRAMMLKPDHPQIKAALDVWNKLGEPWPSRVRQIMKPYETATTPSVSKNARHVPEGFESLVNTGESLRVIGNAKAGLAILEEALNRNRDSAEAWLSYAIALRDLDRFSECSKAAEQSIKLNPKLAEAWAMYAESFYWRNQHENAQRVVAEALQHGLACAALYELAAKLLMNANRPEQAVHFYSKAEAADPDNPQIKLKYAEALLGLRRLQEAIRKYSEVLELKSDEIYALLNRGAAYLLIQDYQSARSDLELAAKLKPDHPEAHANLGIAILATKGNPAEALEHFNIAHRLSPDDPSIIENRQLCLEMLRREAATAATSSAGLRRAAPAPTRRAPATAGAEIPEDMNDVWEQAQGLLHRLAPAPRAALETSMKNYVAALRQGNKKEIGERAAALMDTLFDVLPV